MTRAMPALEGYVDPNWRQPKARPFTLREGSRIPRPLPVEMLAMAKLSDEYQALVTRQREVVSDLEQAQVALGRAQQDDRDAYAKAIRSGKPDPGKPAELAARAKIEELVRKRDALGSAREEVDREARAVLDLEADTYRDAISRVREGVVNSTLEAVAAIDVAYRKLRDLDNVDGWISGRGPRGTSSAVVTSLTSIKRDLESRVRPDDDEGVD